MPKVLVADDNSNIQKMAANALKDLGIEVVGVANGEAAVKKIPDMRPDLILADVFMPVRDGYELCDWVKKNELFSSIPVFLLVGAFDPLDEQRVQVVKADGIIKKPFVPPDRLITVVQAMLERVAQQKHTDSLKEAHDHFSAHVPHVEETQKLTEEEVKSITQPAAAAAAPMAPMPVMEPEPVEYGARQPQINLGESSAPAFADMLGDEAEPEPPSFRASIADEDARPPVMDYDIKEAQREPSPDLPPIKVDFSGESEPMELIRDDRDSGAASAAVAHAGKLEDLVTNPNEWLETSAGAPPPVAANAPILETALPPMPTISVEPPAPPPEPPKAEPMGVPSSDLPGLEWSAPPAPPEPPPMQAAPPPPPPPPPAPASATLVQTLTPELIPPAPTVNPYVVDEIVDKVMMQLQPQIVHRITTEVGKAIESLQPRILDSLQRDVIRPLAEELLRGATKK